LGFVVIWHGSCFGHVFSKNMLIWL
jgi:hypothetical protein